MMAMSIVVHAIPGPGSVNRTEEPKLREEGPRHQRRLSPARTLCPQCSSSVNGRADRRQHVAWASGQGRTEPRQAPLGPDGAGEHSRNRPSQTQGGHLWGCVEYEGCISDRKGACTCRCSTHICRAQRLPTAALGTGATSAVLTMMVKPVHLWRVRTRTARRSRCPLVLSVCNVTCSSQQSQHMWCYEPISLDTEAQKVTYPCSHSPSSGSWDCGLSLLGCTPFSLS